MIGTPRFELVTKYKGAEDLLLPRRSTEFSAGYDFFAAEDMIIPSYWNIFNYIKRLNPSPILSLSEAAEFYKKNGFKPSLIPTGVKVYLKNNQYLKLLSRSSSPLKHFLICSNGNGIIDADYSDNAANEGHIFFQAMNLGPSALKIKAGDKICQGIISTYEVTTDDNATDKRQGGFGSTGS